MRNFQLPSLTFTILHAAKKLEFMRLANFCFFRMVKQGKLLVRYHAWYKYLLLLLFIYVVKTTDALLAAEPFFSPTSEQYHAIHGHLAESNSVYGLAISDDTAYAAFLYCDSTIVVWDIHNKKVILKTAFNKQHPNIQTESLNFCLQYSDIAFSFDNSTLIIGDRDSSLFPIGQQGNRVGSDTQIISSTTGKVLNRFGYPYFWIRATQSYGKCQLILLNIKNNSIEIVDSVSGKIVDTFHFEYSPEKQRIIDCSPEKTVLLQTQSQDLFSNKTQIGTHRNGEFITSQSKKNQFDKEIPQITIGDGGGAPSATFFGKNRIVFAGGPLSHDIFEYRPHLYNIENHDIMQLDIDASQFWQLQHIDEKLNLAVFGKVKDSICGQDGIYQDEWKSSIVIIDTTSGKLVQTILIDAKDAIYRFRARIDPQGKKLIVITSQNEVLSYDLASGKIIEKTNIPYKVAFHSILSLSIPRRASKESGERR